MFAAPIATYAVFLGFWIDKFEPMAWAEELIEPARAIDHPGLAAEQARDELVVRPARYDRRPVLVEARVPAVNVRFAVSPRRHRQTNLIRKADRSSGAGCARPVRPTGEAPH